MGKLISIFAVLIIVSSARAADTGLALESRFHSVLNVMVQKVRAAENPAEKRVLLQNFVDRMQTGLQQAEAVEPSSRELQSLFQVEEKFRAYQSELYGRDGYLRVPDSGLDDFASYMRQGMEQAPIGGGVYISGAALVVILILLLILVR